MTKVSPASSFGAFSGAGGRRPKAKRLSRAMVDLLEPRRLLAPWITTDFAGGVSCVEMEDVEVADGKAYVAGEGFLTILDVSGTGTPIQLGRLSVSHTGVSVSGSYAYTWGGASGSDPSLRIVDVSNPAAPVVVGSCLDGVGVGDACIVGSYAYLVSGPGLQIIDISNPTAPMLTGSLTITGARGVAVAGPYAYVTGYGLTVANVADPANPVIVGSSYPRGGGSKVAVSGSAVYTVGGGFDVIDVSNPSAPVGVTWWGMSGTVRDVKVSDSKVYMGEAGMLDIIDVSNPLGPSVLSQLPTSGTGQGVAVSGSTVYVAGGLAGLQIINATDPSRPTKISAYDPSSGSCLAIAGSIVYGNAGTSAGLHMFDIQNFDKPIWLGKRDTPTRINDIAISGSYLYAAEETHFEIFNISTPSNPIRVGSRYMPDPSHPEWLRGIAVSGSYAYTATYGYGGFNGLQVFDIATPSVPTLVGQYAISDKVSDVVISGTLAYIVSQNASSGKGTLWIIDVSDPANPLRLSSLSTSINTTHIAMVGSRVYAGGDIIDVSNPAAPVRLSSSVIPDVLAVSGSFAFVDSDPLGGSDDILDISDPTAITRVGLYRPGSQAVALYGSSAVFARHPGGIETVRFIIGENEPATDISLSQTSIAENLPAGTVVGTLSSTCPNPANTFGYALTGGTGSTDNSRFTISGNQLKTNAIFNYEVKNSYSIRIRSTDAVGQWFDKVFTISVTDVNERPTNISLSASSVVENRPVGTVVGTFSSTDPDAGNTFTYSLVSGTGDVDNGSFTISGDQLLTAASFDYHSRSSYSILVRSTDQGGLFREKSFTISVTEDASAPTVTGVYVRGSTWSSNYLSFLAANTVGSSTTYGYAIPVGTGASQLETLPWRNLNRISIAFSEDVSVAQAQFAIAGSVGSYSVSGFAYSSADHVATWSLSAAIGPDKLYVAVPGSGTSPITDAAGNVLDGEWVNPSSYGQVGSSDSFPSGNGVAGGDFAFRFDVLPGDSSGGSLGKVNVADALQTKGRSGVPVTVSNYRSDFDGNNAVNVADVLYVKGKSNVYSLPVNPPVVPVFGLASSQVSLLQKDRLLTLW